MNTTDHRIAIDIGGTFTDVVTLAPDGTVATHKLLSTPLDYAEGVLDGLLAHVSLQGLRPSDIDQVLHACTVATNAVLEGKGANTALITTRGFRDVLELRRTRIPRLYDLLYETPRPLVPRRLRLEVSERIDAHGKVISPLDAQDVDEAVQAIRSAGVSAVAVCLLHSYANDTHEREIGRALRRELPDCFVSLSVEVLPQMLEYERTSTTVINAYVGPPVHHYLQSLVEKLQKANVRGKVMVMQSSGGILDVDSVMQRPAAIVECGPAAGVVGAAAFGDLIGQRNLISFDMGGTTAKISLIENGQVQTCTDYEVGGDETGSAATPLGGGGGHALKLPAIDIAEIGAGGGSIARLDKAGLIKVGPRSAGAAPGPACYGAGGDLPTVTDANVVLGYLNPQAIAGGAVPIDVPLAERAIKCKLAEPMGRGVLETAHGIHQIANANMGRAIKAVTTYRGRDPRDFVLMAFGGSGGVHAVPLARELRIGRVLIPPVAGVFSALGLLLADMQVNISRSFLRVVKQMLHGDAVRIYAELQAQAAERIGGDRSMIRFARFVDMRYTGQAHELMIPLPDGLIHEASVAALSASFEREHERSYGHSFSGGYGLEAVNLRLVATKQTHRPQSIRPADDEAAGTSGQRPVHFGPQFGTLESPVLNRRHLKAMPSPGPCIIEDVEGTIVVPPDCQVSADETSTVVIDLTQNGDI